MEKARPVPVGCLLHRSLRLLDLIQVVKPRQSVQETPRTSKKRARSCWVTQPVRQGAFKTGDWATALRQKEAGQWDTAGSRPCGHRVGIQVLTGGGPIPADTLNDDSQHHPLRKPHTTASPTTMLEVASALPYSTGASQVLAPAHA